MTIMAPWDAAGPGATPVFEIRVIAGLLSRDATRRVIHQHQLEEIKAGVLHARH